MPDPIDDYLEKKEKTAAQRRSGEDVNLVTQWQQQAAAGAPDPALTEQLYKRFEPVRRNAQNKYKAQLTGPGFDTKARTIMAESWKNWDPTRGASPTTHMTNNLQRLYRENLQQQSVQNTEADAGYFGHMDTADAELQDELGRDPDDNELVGRMNELMPAKKRIDAARLQQLRQRKGGSVISSSFESNPEGPSVAATQAHAEAQNLDLLPYDLDDRELSVYNHLFGRGGQRATQSTNTIAKKLGVSAPTVSKLRKSILQKAGVTEGQLKASKKPRKLV
jgi:DNA-directed RNA polymerase specialized sigma subunit